MNMFCRYAFSFLLFALTTGLSFPGEKSELSWTTKQSVHDVLNQFGYKNMTVLEGFKIEDTKGYSITAHCVRNDENYLATLWVSIDWSEGRVISVESRKTGVKVMPNKNDFQRNNGEPKNTVGEFIIIAIMTLLTLVFIWKIMKA